jgi:hypothetical protein
LVLFVVGIYELRGSDELRCLNIHAKSHRDWFAYLKVNRGHTYTDTHTAHTYRQQGDLISVLLKYQNKESRLKKEQESKRYDTLYEHHCIGLRSLILVWNVHGWNSDYH